MSDSKSIIDQKKKSQVRISGKFFEIQYSKDTDMTELDIHLKLSGDIIDHVRTFYFN